MRIIYNTSFIVHEKAENQWIEFMQATYVPAVRESGLCRDIIFTKVSIDQPEGKTYSLQLVFDTQSRQEDFLNTCLPALEDKLISLYANQYFCFSSILTEI